MIELETTTGCLQYALGQIYEPGIAAEFGVATGASLRRIVAGMPAGSSVYGFDSFDGLPEDWRDGFPAGTFRTTPPDVPGAQIIVGEFDASLRGWTPGALALVHVDCDLYSSTATVLLHLTVAGALEPGCLIVFDEYHGYPGAEGHEERAFLEWTLRESRSWEPIARGPEQLLVRLTEGGPR